MPIALNAGCLDEFHDSYVMILLVGACLAPNVNPRWWSGKFMFSYQFLAKAALSALLTASLSQAGYAYQIPQEKSDLAMSPAIRSLQTISQGVSELADQSSKAIVFISVSKIIKGQPYGTIDPFDFFFGPNFRGPQYNQPRERKQEGLGSGFFIDLKKGYIITNNHVIEGADEISLKLANDETYTAKVLGSDPNTDVAVVQINDKKFNRKGLTQLYLSDSSNIKVGEFVIALGAPFGLEASLSFGSVSATGRGNLNITNLGNFIQTDAAINPGNSGGPLINMEGKVIGMNTAIYSRTGSSAGIGFAVPSNLVKEIALQLINKGAVARGYLGVALSQELDEELISGLNLPPNTKGALISRVENNTPADKAGLESGDVIIEVNKKIIKSRQDLTNIIGLMPPGKKVNITFYRAGKKKQTTLKLGSFPGSDVAMKEKNQKESQDLAGLSLETLNRSRHSEFINRYQIQSKSGLLVTDIDPKSKAAAAGIRPGDVLLEANRKKLQSPDDFEDIYEDSKRLLIQLERSGTYLFASIRK